MKIADFALFKTCGVGKEYSRIKSFWSQAPSFLGVKLNCL